jgi:NADPH:quinone reductase-like Zn-dependent oxidoreductase
MDKQAARAPAATVVTTRGTASIARKPADAVVATRPTDRTNDPWLRGVMLTASVQHSLVVTRVGDPDYSGLVQYMRKPGVAVVMTFSNDPHLGMTTDAFTGSAVVFQATVTFDQGPRRTAALQ